MRDITQHGMYALIGLATLAVILPAAGGPALAQTVVAYVDVDASPGGDGTSWEEAYTDLQSALTRTTVPDEVWVAEGTYYPTSGSDQTISFVLKNGIPWEMLPQGMGCGSGMTCWRRLRDWQEAGVWQNLHELLLAKLREADQIDWSRAVVDSASIRAVGGGGKNRAQSY